MRSLLAPALALFMFVVSLGQPALSAEPQAGPTNKPPAVKDLDTPREFPKIASREAWQARAKEIREQVLVSCGLWPMPEKTRSSRVSSAKSNARVTAWRKFISAAAGFYLAGTCIVRSGAARRPFPAILNPHGHWTVGRMADVKDGSIAARCISSPAKA